MSSASRFRAFFRPIGAGTALLTSLVPISCRSGAAIRGAETSAGPSGPSAAAETQAHGAAGGAAPGALDGARERARAMVLDMTLEEKLAALVHVWDWSYQKSPEALCTTTAFGPGSFERIGLY